MCLSLLSTPGSFSRHPKWPAVCRTSMRPSTCLESRPTTALICTRTSPAASNHVKSTSANQIETDFISSFLSMQLNTLESHAKLERWTVFGFLFFFWHIHHTHKHFLTYTPTLLQKDTLGTLVVLVNITFCQTIAGETGGTGRGGAGGVILGHRCLWPSDTLQEERAVLLPFRVLFAKQSVLAKAMYNGSDSVAHPLLLQKNYFYTAWNAAVLIAIDILLTVIFYFCLFVYVQQRLNWFHTGYSLLQMNLIFLLV